MGRKNIVLDSHGELTNAISYSGLEWFDTHEAAEIRVADLANSEAIYAVEDFYVFQAEGGYMIGFGPVPLNHEVRPAIPIDAVVVNGQCFGALNHQVWRNGGQYAFWGFLDEPYVATSNAYMECLVTILSCWDFSSDGLEGLASIAGSNCSASDGQPWSEISGNPKWKMNSGCVDWVDPIEFGWYSQGATYFVLSSGGAGCTVEIYGEYDNSDVADSLATIVPTSPGGVREVSAFFVNVADGYDRLKICVVSELGQYREVSWIEDQAQPGDIPIPPGTTYGGIATPDPQSGWYESTLSDDIACDVIVYVGDGDGDLGAMANYRASRTCRYLGDYFQVRSFHGTDNANDAKDLYFSVWNANQQHNANHPESPMREFPILLLVGHPWHRNGVIPESFQVQFPGEIDPRNFLGYGGLTDIDGDCIPDGPILFLPARAVSEVSILGAYSEDYAKLDNARPDGLVSCYVHDRYFDYGTGIFGDLMYDRVETYALQRGAGYNGIWNTSYYTNVYDREGYMTAIGRTHLEAGVDQVWFSGYSSGANQWSPFLNEVEVTTPATNYLVFAISCGTGDVYYPVATTNVEEHLFNSVGAGTCVGVVGQMNAGTHGQHGPMNDILVDVLSEQTEPAYLADVVLEAQRRFMVTYPEWRYYAYGLTAFGLMPYVRGPVVAQQLPTIDRQSIGVDQVFNPVSRKSSYSFFWNTDTWTAPWLDEARLTLVAGDGGEMPNVVKQGNHGNVTSVVELISDGGQDVYRHTLTVSEIECPLGASWTFSVYSKNSHGSIECPASGRLPRLDVHVCPSN